MGVSPVANVFHPYGDEERRRVRRVLVSANLLVALFKQTTHPDQTVVFEGMPPDARVVGVGAADDLVHTLYIDVESAAFSPGGPTPMELRITSTAWTYDPVVMAAMRAGRSVTVDDDG